MQLESWSNHRTWKSLAWLAMFGVALALPAGAMTIDELEGIGADNTAVTSLVIEGVTVTITQGNSLSMIAATYGGANTNNFSGTAQNVPLIPANVSGTRFIGGNPASITIVVPITFSFSAPVEAFQLTTLDLLENAGASTDSIALVAYDSINVEIVRHQRTGDQGASGLDLDWLVSSSSGNIAKVELIAVSFVTSGIGFGIDDIGVQVPEPSTYALACMAALGLWYRRRRKQA
jgi:hypothetical protein